MATFTEFLAGTILVDKPAPASQGIALYENPIAIAEGAADAPRIAQKSAAGTSSSGTLSFTSLDTYGGVVVHGAVFTDGSNRVLTVALSDDGTTYAGASSLLDDNGLAGPYTFSLFIDFATGAFKCTHNSIDPTLPLYAAGTLAGAGSGVTAIRFAIGGTSTVSALVLPHGGESAT